MQFGTRPNEKISFVIESIYDARRSLGTRFYLNFKREQFDLQVLMIICPLQEKKKSRCYNQDTMKCIVLPNDA